MQTLAKFRDSEQSKCEAFIRLEIVRRGMPDDAVSPVVAVLLNALAMPDLEEDEHTGRRNMLELTRMRTCWVIRDEDLDIVGTLVKFVAPVAGAGAAVASVAGAAAATPVAAGIAATLAFLVNVCLNARRKGVTLSPISMRTLLVLKERRGGSTVAEVKEALELFTGNQFSDAEVAELLTALSKAQMNASGATVAVAFERDGLWYSAA